MLYRKKEKEIKEWFDSKIMKKALLLTGARQVGKTYLIEAVLKKEGADYVKFDLIEEPSVADALNDLENSGVEAFLSRLSILTDKELKKGKTVIFIDEVQKCKEIVTKIKYLVSEGSFRYILSGSLLGVELSDIESAPVGFLSTIKMFPLDFEEFLLALNMKRDTISLLKECYERRVAVDSFIHERIMETFYTYLVVGGMPEAVDIYKKTNDFNKVRIVHQSIIPQYKNDFSKYESSNKKLHLIKTYEMIPEELNKKNKRYYFTHLDKNIKTERYTDTFEWLIHAGVAIPVYNVEEPKIPLRASKKSNLFKLFMSDVGLLSSIYGRSAIIDTLSGKRSVNYGAVFENVIAQELCAHGYQLYYFNSKKQGELDFVIEYGSKCLALEVKSGKDYSVHSALNNVIGNNNYGMEYGVVLCKDNVNVKDNIIYMPVYMIMFFDDRDLPIPYYEGIDLSSI